MLLTNEDIQRIESNGYSKKEFCLNLNETNGFWQLRNINGRCYFLTDKGKCSIYTFRPQGCRVYPLVFEISEQDVIIDNDCREVQWFAKQNYSEKQLSQVKKIAKNLLNEKSQFSKVT